MGNRQTQHKAAGSKKETDQTQYLEYDGRAGPPTCVEGTRTPTLPLLQPYPYVVLAFGPANPDRRCSVAARLVARRENGCTFRPQMALVAVAGRQPRGT